VFDDAGAYATTELCDGDDTSGWSLNDDDLFPTCAVDNYSNVSWAGDQNSDGFYGFDGDNLYINVESYPNIGAATLTVNGMIMQWTMLIGETMLTGLINYQLQQAHHMIGL
jgi:hypothetical protein